MSTTSQKIKARRLTLIAIGIVILLAAAGCGGSGAASEGAVGTQDAGSGEGTISVVTSFYPIYFLAREIGGDRADVVNLVPAGVEPHDWTPKSKDMARIAKAKLFLYNGAGLEGWVDDFLQGAGQVGGLTTAEVSKGIELLDGNGHTEEDGHAQEDSRGEGDGHAEKDGHAEEDGHGHEEEEEGHSHGGVDPHTWVSPKSAIVMAANIRDSFVKVDSDGKEVYEANYAALKQRLEKLDADFASTLAPLPKKQIVVSHQAFSYLCRDYGLEQRSIMGLAPDAEPRAQDLLRIAEFVKEHDVRYIFFEELVSPALAKTMARETGAETLVLNPLEGLTPEQEAKGENYITLMEANLQNLAKALQ